MGTALIGYFGRGMMKRGLRPRRSAWDSRSRELLIKGNVEKEVVKTYESEIAVQNRQNDSRNIKCKAVGFKEKKGIRRWI